MPISNDAAVNAEPIIQLFYTRPVYSMNVACLRPGTDGKYRVILQRIPPKHQKHLILLIYDLKAAFQILP